MLQRWRSALSALTCCCTQLGCALHRGLPAAVPGSYRAGVLQRVCSTDWCAPKPGPPQLYVQLSHALQLHEAAELSCAPVPSVSGLRQLPPRALSGVLLPAGKLAPAADASQGSDCSCTLSAWWPTRPARPHAPCTTLLGSAPRDAEGDLGPLGAVLLVQVQQALVLLRSPLVPAYAGIQVPPPAPHALQRTCGQPGPTCWVSGSRRTKDSMPGEVQLAHVTTAAGLAGSHHCLEWAFLVTAAATCWSVRPSRQREISAQALPYCLTSFRRRLSSSSVHFSLRMLGFTWAHSAAVSRSCRRDRAPLQSSLYLVAPALRALLPCPARDLLGHSRPPAHASQ